MQQIMTKKALMEYGVGLLLSIAGFWAAAGLHYALTTILRLNIQFGGDKARVFWALFLGLPLGCVLGILAVDKLIYKNDGINLLAAVLALAMGFVGAYIGLVMLDKIGGFAVLFIPMLVAFLCLLGFNKFFIY
jgi:hypothetical protein